jgi:prevent-host-death family protein
VVAVKKSSIGIREARINFSKLIQDVRSGMEIIITDRGKPVARLVPAQGQNLSLEERIKNYESCGLIEVCVRPVKTVEAPIELPEGYVQSCIREEQDDG